MDLSHGDLKLITEAVYDIFNDVIPVLGDNKTGKVGAMMLQL